MAGNQPRNVNAHIQATRKMKESDRLKRGKTKRNADAFVANGSPISTASFGGTTFGGTTSGNALPSVPSTAGGLFGGSFDAGNAGGFNFSAGSSGFSNPFANFSQSTTTSSQQSVPDLSFSKSTPSSSFEGEEPDRSLETKAQWQSGWKEKNPKPKDHTQSTTTPNVFSQNTPAQTTPAPSPQPNQQPWGSQDAPARDSNTFFSGLGWGKPKPKSAETSQSAETPKPLSSKLQGISPLERARRKKPTYATENNPCPDQQPFANTFGTASQTGSAINPPAKSTHATASNTQPAQQPLNNMFGTTSQTGSAINPPAESTHATASNTQPAQQPLSNAFGTTSQTGSAINPPAESTHATASNTQPAQQPLSNMFGTASQTGSAINPPAESTHATASNTQPAQQPLSNMFGTASQTGSTANSPTKNTHHATANNIQPGQQPLSNMFGTASQTSSTSIPPTKGMQPQQLFGAQNMPASNQNSDQLLGSQSTPQPAVNIFGQPTQNSLTGNQSASVQPKNLFAGSAGGQSRVSIPQQEPEDDNSEPTPAKEIPQQTPAEVEYAGRYEQVCQGVNSLEICPPGTEPSRAKLSPVDGLVGNPMFGWFQTLDSQVDCDMGLAAGFSFSGGSDEEMTDDNNTQYSNDANGSSIPAVQSISSGHAAPTSNVFQFGGTQPIQPALSSESPAAPPSAFSFFGQAQSAPPSNAFTDSVPQSSQQTHMTSQVSQQPLFGAPVTTSSPQPTNASTNNPFAFLSQPAGEPAAASSPNPANATQKQSLFSFGAQSTNATPASESSTNSQSIFPQPSTFGTAPAAPSPAAPKSLFGTPTPAPAPAASTSLFGTPAPAPAPAPATSKSLFGTPAPAPAPAPADSKSLFGTPAPAPAPAASTSLFGTPTPAPAPAPAASKSLFGTPAPAPAPKLNGTSSQPLFPPQSTSSAQSPKKQSASQFAGASAAPSATTPNNASLHHPLDNIIGAEYPKSLRAINGTDTSVIESRIPAKMSQSNRHIFIGHHRLKTLKALYLKHIKSLPLDADLLEPAKYYTEKRELILKDIENKVVPDLGPISGKRKSVTDLPDSTHINKKNRNEDGFSMNSDKSATTNASQSQPITGIPATSATPKFFPSASAVSSTPSAPPATPKSTVTKPTTDYTPSPAKSKRKADVQLTKDFPTEEDNEKSDRSKTSKLFSDVLDGKVPTPATSPRKILPLKKRAGIGSQGSPAPKSPTKTQNPFTQMSSGPATSTAESDKTETTPAVAQTPMTPAAIKNPFQVLPAVTTTPTTAPPANPFQIKPAATPSMPSAIKPTAAPSMPSAIKPPSFGPVAATNFLSQFGKKVEETEAKALREAIENDMDSDEDEEEFTANFKAKRAEQKAKLAEELANIKGGFKLATSVPSPEKPASKDSSVAPASSAPSAAGSGSSTPAEKPSSSGWFPNLGGSGASSPGIASSNGSVFDGAAQKKPVFTGFSVSSASDKAHDSDSDSDESDAEDNEESGSSSKLEAKEPRAANGPTTSTEETAVDSSPAPQSSSSGGLFDRISKDPNGKPMFDKENAAKVPSTLFGSTNSFGSSTPADNTWKPNTPIKFGTSSPSFTFGTSGGSTSTPAPAFGSSTSGPKSGSSTPVPTFAASTFESKSGSSTPTPAINFSASQPATFGNNSGAAKPTTSLFGTSSAMKPATTTGNIFGTTTTTPATTTGSIFGTATATAPATTTGSIFGNLGATKSATSSLFPSAAGSTATSRESSVGGNDGSADDHMPLEEQVDLTAANPGEEDEEVVHKLRAKALLFSVNDKKWNTKGLGPLKVLKHKETGACRIILRADPSATIVLNKGLMSAAKYEVNGKTVKVLAAADDGKGLESWVLQLKTPEEAEKLSAVLLESKPQS